MQIVTAKKFAYRHIADTVKELIRLNPWWRDAMLRNEVVPSSNSSSTPCLLLTKSMSAIEAATVPGKFFMVNRRYHLYHVSCTKKTSKHKPPLKYVFFSNFATSADHNNGEKYHENKFDIHWIILIFRISIFYICNGSLNGTEAIVKKDKLKIVNSSTEDGGNTIYPFNLKNRSWKEKPNDK